MSTISSRTGYFSEALPIRLASKALQLQWRVVTIPWSTFLFWLSCCCSLLLRFLVIAGAPPGEFYNKTKVSLHAANVIQVVTYECGDLHALDVGLRESSGLS